MKLTKNLLMNLVKEEYVRLYLESQGYNPSHKQVRQLSEGLDEGFFDSFKKSKDLSGVVASLSSKIKDLRDSLAKKLKSKEKKIVDDEAIAAAESAIALGFAKEFSKTGKPELAQQAQEFIKDQSSVYPLIKDILPSKALPMKSRGRGPGYGIGRARSAGGAFAVGESKEVLKKLALEISAKSLLREHNSSVTQTKVLRLIEEDLVELNEGLLDSLLSADTIVANFYKDAYKQLSLVGAQQPEQEMLKLFATLDPQKYDVELFGAEVEDVGPPGAVPSKSADMSSAERVKALDLPTPASKKGSPSVGPAKPPVKKPSEEMVSDYKPLGKFVNRKRGSETFYSKQLADILFDIEQGEIRDYEALASKVAQARDDIEMTDDLDTLKKFGPGSRVFLSFFKKHPDAFRKVADESLPDILGESRRRRRPSAPRMT
ncbi:MAG: hypothetical protein FJZ60_01090 [Chlamydiae bacterium]|nr:hypothetical protein [Chlamydiota bacterium]